MYLFVLRWTTSTSFYRLQVHVAVGKQYIFHVWGNTLYLPSSCMRSFVLSHCKLCCKTVCWGLNSPVANAVCSVMASLCPSLHPPSFVVVDLASIAGKRDNYLSLNALNCKRIKGRPMTHIHDANLAGRGGIQDGGMRTVKGQWVQSDRLEICVWTTTISDITSAAIVWL